MPLVATHRLHVARGGFAHASCAFSNSWLGKPGRRLLCKPGTKHNTYGYTNSMRRQLNLVDKFKRRRSAYRRRMRLLFPSPAEVRFMRLMGCWVITTSHIRHWHTDFPLRLLVIPGGLYRRERLRREVRVGKHYVDFGNDIQRAIEVDGEQYHRDVIYETARDSYLHEHGWLVLHVPAFMLYKNPKKVCDKAEQFLTK